MRKTLALSIALVIGLASASGALAKTEQCRDAHGKFTKCPTAAAPMAAPAGATAKCKDGTYSMSKTHSGTCSGHKGVANWIK